MRRNYFTERDFAPRKQPHLIANRKSSSAFRISANSCAKEEKSGLNFFHAPEVSLYIDREGQGILTFGQFTLGIALSSFKPGDPFSLRAPAWTLSWLSALLSPLFPLSFSSSCFPPLPSVKCILTEGWPVQSRKYINRSPSISRKTQNRAKL